MQSPFLLNKKRIVFIIVLTTQVLFLLQIIGSFVFIRLNTLSYFSARLSDFLTRIEHGLVYNKADGTWDISLYNADPFTPFPTGSGGFSHPLYIITKEGFVIERTNPIAGFLDTADYQQLMEYQTPQTVSTITNEKWRIMARPIMRNNEVLGVIHVAYYNPPEELTKVIDQKLYEASTTIDKKIELKNTEIDVSGLDIRTIHFDVSFEIVSVFNKVITSNGRIPASVDPSYFDQVVQQAKIQIIKDGRTKKQYFVSTRVLRQNAEPIGIIVTAEPLDSLSIMLIRYLEFALLSSFLIAIPLAFICFQLLKKENENMHKTVSKHKEYVPQRIVYNKLKGTITVDSLLIDIPYASKQFYLLQSIFSAPRKRWEQDEIQEKMGEEISRENARALYDASLAINKKAGVHLIVYKNKIFRINPNFLDVMYLEKNSSQS